MRTQQCSVVAVDVQREKRAALRAVAHKIQDIRRVRGARSSRRESRGSDMVVGADE